MILNQGNRLNKTPSHKSNHADTRKKTHWMYIMQIIRLKMRVVSTTEKGHLLSVTRLWKILKDGDLTEEWNSL